MEANGGNQNEFSNPHENVHSDIKISASGDPTLDTFDGKGNKQDDDSLSDHSNNEQSVESKIDGENNENNDNTNCEQTLKISNNDEVKEDSSLSDLKSGNPVSADIGENADDLEAVSDDELAPDVSNNQHFSHNPTSNLEDLSSEDEEIGRTPPCSERLALDAEPISDGEDIGQDDNKSIDQDAIEAGELPSPKAPTQPVKELLKEAEPISADETGDTDGELHSEDECKGLKADLESIDSDDDMGGGDSLQNQKNVLDSGSAQVQNSDVGQQYMESISDEETLDSVKKGENTSGDKGSCGIEKDIENKPVTTNFNEHQEELDYEENDGDETDPKVDELNPDDKDDDEEGEVKDGPSDDKDEGELSDDDCEEGEIKEPGLKRPFIPPMCRFFQRGHCTWGINCRFLHPGVNDKGNYQMIEIPGFPPPGARPPPGGSGEWEEAQEEEPADLPPPPIPDIPHVETAWERGLRIAKEQRKKASERKEKEPDFEEKRLNLKLDEDKDINKENERMPKIVVKDPYYDQQAYEEDEYYKSTQNSWENNAHYENFEVRYNREHSFSPPYREKPPAPPASRYQAPSFSPPMDKFGRQREERQNNYRPEPPVNDYPSPVKRPDEWIDPWRRSKSPQRRKRRSKSRGRRNRRSLSDSSNSSRSSSSSGSSRSSRSGSSSGSSRVWKRNISRRLAPSSPNDCRSRSRTPDGAPPGIDRHDRYGHSPHSRYNDQPRSQVSVKGRGGYNNFDSNRGFRGGRYNRGRGGYDRGGWRGRGGRGGHFDHYNSNYNNYDNRNSRDPRRGGRDGPNRNRARSPPDRPLPYIRPRPKSVSSHSSSSSSRSRSRSNSRYSDSSRSRSHSRSSSNSSRSSSSSSGGSADSEHLYRDLGSPVKSSRGPAGGQKKKRTNSFGDRSHSKGGPPLKGGPPPKGGSSKGPSSQKHPFSSAPSQHPMDLDRIPRPRDPPKTSQPSSVPSKYSSRNAPQVPVKAKDPLKTVGQKSNIKLTLLPKQQQQQSGLGNRPNPLDSPPHKRRQSDRDSSPPSAPPAKRANIPVPSTQAAARIPSEKTTKFRQDKGKSPPIPTSVSSQRAKAAVSPQKLASSGKSRLSEPALGKTAPKVASVPTAATTGPKAKKSMSSRREELLKQLKAVEDAIARKKTKIG